jgi:pyrimidine-specific ribonucleoside hydrolase
MDKYLYKHPNGKKFHDPLAACAAIDESIIEWREVEIFREKGKWGSKLFPDSNTWISINYDKEKFEKVLLEK